MDNTLEEYYVIYCTPYLFYLLTDNYNDEFEFKGVGRKEELKSKELTELYRERQELNNKITQLKVELRIKNQKL